MSEDTPAPNPPNPDHNPPKPDHNDDHEREEGKGATKRPLAANKATGAISIEVGSRVEAQYSGDDRWSVSTVHSRVSDTQSCRYPGSIIAGGIAGGRETSYNVRYDHYGNEELRQIHQIRLDPNSPLVGGNTVFVGGIDPATTAKHLWEAMQTFGAIERSWVAQSTKRFSFGFVRYRNSESASRAVESKGRDLKINTRDQLTIDWAKRKTNPPDVFCDLDGVLCDFEKQCEVVLKEPVNQIQQRGDSKEISRMWQTLQNTKGFYANLPWMKHGKALWNIISRFNPTILTGCPRGEWAQPQKRFW
eukprot:CAMPEP_0197542680 /NCGR_PEP_ID=MMETSP1318-20131121/67836_1 /TAXON_ID=552666 /ORGANISM="Partenskyella glossopodia, Strain RCC365" /LENGTH=303 /DNA_ID=CAMNT_0043101965 /DNA_START=331 /DNA_END=1239 /DNA_ORIENTATION=-